MLSCATASPSTTSTTTISSSHEQELVQNDDPSSRKSITAVQVIPSTMDYALLECDYSRTTTRAASLEVVEQEQRLDGADSYTRSNETAGDVIQIQDDDDTSTRRHPMIVLVEEDSSRGPGNSKTADLVNANLGDMTTDIIIFTMVAVFVALQYRDIALNCR